MHATKVLQKILTAVFAGLDARNARNLFFAVEALLVGRRLTLMGARHDGTALWCLASRRQAMWCSAWHPERV